MRNEISRLVFASTSSGSVGGSFIDFSFLGLLPVLLFRLFGAERHYTISLLCIFSLPSTLRIAESESVAGVGGKLRPILAQQTPFLFFLRTATSFSSFDILRRPC